MMYYIYLLLTSHYCKVQDKLLIKRNLFYDTVIVSWIEEN